MTSNKNNKPACTLIGTHLSTFTRTVALALLHKDIEYTHIPTPPHSCVALSAHPFGYLPALIIHGQHEDEPDIKLCESQAIVRYIDRLAPEPSLHLRPGKGVALEEKMWEFVSLAGSFGKRLRFLPRADTKTEIIYFIGVPIIERGVVKFRMRAEGKLTEEQILAQLEDGPIVELRRYLEVAESLMAPEGYAFGDKLTWADFFLYPMMADLRMVSEWELVSERLKNWTEKMDLLPETQATRVGTLATGAKLCGVPRKNGRVLCSMPTM